jgi:alanine dehydrogenase
MMPQEELQAVARKKNRLVLGIPKETSFQEHRVPLTPGAVGLLVSLGHEVIIERGAGKYVHYQDNDYSEAGAMVVDSTEEVYKAHMIVKVAPPSHQEIAMLQPKQILISALQLTVQPKDTLKRMMEKKVTAVAWDFIRDSEGIFPVIRAMGEIAGISAIQVGAANLASEQGGTGVLLGGISGVAPATVVVIGAGTVGEFAVRTALGLGAQVKLFDKSIYRLRRLQNDVGQRIFTSVIEPNELRAALKQADLAVGAVRSDHGRTPMVVPESMVQEMKFGSVIVDVSIDRGGCFETSEVTTHDEPIIRKYGVSHYCVPNIASRVPRTASRALSNIFSPLLVDMGEHGGFAELIRMNLGIRNGVYIYNGALTNQSLAEAFNLPCKDLDLLLASF